MQMNKPYTVYRHTSPSGKVYIGITKRNPVRRWNNGKGYRSQIVFDRAIQKYGWDNFKHEILFSDLSKEEAEAKEVELIKLHMATDAKHGYNVENGGNCGEKHSLETRMKISAANKGRSTWAKGRHFTEKHKNNLREANLHKQKGSKPILQLDDSGVVICEYESIRDAERRTNVNRRSISFCLNGINKHAGGYVWKEVTR